MSSSIDISAPSTPPPDDRIPLSQDSDRTEIRAIAPYQIAQVGHQLGAAYDSVSSLVGQELDHFKIESLVGTGGMGAVFRGRDLRLDRIVAIKVVALSDRRADAMRRFRVEAQSAAKLDHPNIARVYYVGETERWSYIVFEYVEGMNLRQIVLERGLLTVDESAYYTCQIADALQHAFERGVVHRDIKPSNILVGTDGQAKLVDMGLARTTELDRSTNDLTASGVTLGTFDYISPEQAHDPRDADTRSDIYSLGCTLYFLLTGQPPFPEGTALQKLLLHGTKMPEDPRFFRDDLSDSLMAILRKMIAKKPRDRYQEPADLVGDLRILADVDGLSWGSSEVAASQSLVLQRSWLAALTPSIVSVICMMIVTMWLYSASQLDARFPLPKIDIADSPSIESDGELGHQPNATITPSSDSLSASELATPESSSLNTSIERVESKRIAPSIVVQLIVDSALVDDGKLSVEPYQLVRTLDEVAGKLPTYVKLRQIVLRSPNNTVSKSLRLPNAAESEISIVSGTGGRARIQFESNSNKNSNAAESRSWIEVPSRLTMSSVDLEWQPPTLGNRQTSLIGLGPSGVVLLDDVTITVKNNRLSELPSVVRIGSELFEPYESTQKGSAINSNASRVQVRRTAVRGECDFIAMNQPSKLEVQVENAWFALSGSMLQLSGQRTLVRSPMVRVDMKRSTCITSQPWLRLTMTNMNSIPVAVVRTSTESIFGGCTSLVEWDASSCDDWSFANQVKRPESMDRWIDLRGFDNAYDVPAVLRLIHVIMSMSTEQVPMDADSPLLRDERGMELQVSWQKSPALDSLKMHDSTPSMYQVLSTSFQSGCRLELLPSISGSN